MAIVHQSFATGSSSSGLSTNATTPAGVAAGDLLVATFYSNSGSTVKANGWDSYLYTMLAGAVGIVILARIADGTEGSAITVNHGSGGVTYGISRFSGTDTVKPIGNLALTNGQPDSTTHVAPSVLTTSANAMVLNVFSNNFGVTYTITGGGATSQWDLGSIMNAGQIQASPGNSPAVTATVAFSCTWLAASLSIRPPETFSGRVQPNGITSSNAFSGTYSDAISDDGNWLIG